MQPAPSRADLSNRGKRLRVGETIDVAQLTEWFVENGFKRVDAVEMPNEFSKRGGIIDVFSADAEAPYRLELFGDEIESLRSFSAASRAVWATRKKSSFSATGLRVSRPILVLKRPA